jgi:hypothetical protein
MTLQPKLNNWFSGRSPVFSYLSASLQGLHTIRAFNMEHKCHQEFDAHQDLHSEAWFLFLSTSRWLAVRLDWLCALFVTAVTFCAVLSAGSKLEKCSLKKKKKKIRRGKKKKNHSAKFTRVAKPEMWHLSAGHVLESSCIAPTQPYQAALSAESRVCYLGNTVDRQPHWALTYCYLSQSTANENEKSTHCHHWGLNL